MSTTICIIIVAYALGLLWKSIVLDRNDKSIPPWAVWVWPLDVILVIVIMVVFIGGSLTFRAADYVYEHRRGVAAVSVFSILLVVLLFWSVPGR